MVLCVGYELTGLAQGGERLSRLKRNYAKAVELLVELASLQVWAFHPFITLMCYCGSMARWAYCPAMYS